MFSLMPSEVATLLLVVVGALTGLLLAVFVLFPRSAQTVPALVTCPLLQRRVTAQVARDDWTRRLTDVTRCSVLGGDVRFCRKACLAADDAQLTIPST